jgi:hypothetical protein
VSAANENSGSKVAMGIEPRNENQINHALTIAKSGEGPPHLVIDASGNTEKARH